MNIIKKALRRLFRIFCGKKGVYCQEGKGNVYGKYLFLHENTSVGSYNHIGNGTMTANAKIGNYCSIAPYVKLGHMDRPSMRSIRSDLAVSIRMGVLQRFMRTCRATS